MRRATGWRKSSPRRYRWSKSGRRGEIVDFALVDEAVEIEAEVAILDVADSFSGIRQRIERAVRPEARCGRSGKRAIDIDRHRAGRVIERAGDECPGIEGDGIGARDIRVIVELIGDIEADGAVGVDKEAVGVVSDSVIATEEDIRVVSRIGGGIDPGCD